MEITSGGYSEMVCHKNRTNISALSNGEKWHFGSFSRMGHIIVIPTDRDQGSNRTWQCSPHTHTHTHTHTQSV